MRSSNDEVNGVVDQTDFLVVGGGIAGALAADALSPLGSVTLIEREGAYGYHTTGRSAAMYTPCYGNAAVRAITVASGDFYRAPPEGFSDAVLAKPRPTLQFARQADQDYLREMAKEFAVHVPEVRVLDHAETLGFAPFLRAGDLALGMLDPTTADLDVDAILQGFLRRARRQGAKTLNNVTFVGARWRGQDFSVTTNQGEIIAKTLVNAAGAWGDQVAQAAGVAPIGLVPKRRTAFTFAAPTDADLAHWPMVIDVRERFYIKPDAGMILGSPCDATPSAPMDAWAEDMDVAEGVARIEEAMTFSITRLAHTWAGLRTFAPDLTPVVGRDPKVPGFWWFVGQGGYGIQTAPAMGRILGTLMAQDRLPDEVAALGVTRADLAPQRFSA